MIRIDFSENKIEALLTIQASGNDYPTEPEIRAELNNKHIIFGLDETLLSEILIKKEPIRKLIIARGIAPVYGKNATIEWKTGINNPDKITIPGTDRVDFKKARFTESVKAKQVLAIKTFAVSGTDGKSVLGEIVPSFGRDIVLPQGRNTYLSEDTSTLYAEISGSAFMEEDKIHVDEIYHVKGNVSYATGNIKFDGPVVIEGDVLSGFRVEARDSIYIGGNVEAANVYSQNGDVTVNYGILGKNRAKILAGGDLKCGYIQDATVGVRKNIQVEHYVINSTITAGGAVDVSSNEGIIRGGDVTAEKGIVANEVGSERNVYTELRIRNQGENESQSALWDLSRQRSELSMRLSSLTKREEFLKVLQARVTELSIDKQVELDFISGEISRIRKKVDELNIQELDLQKSASKVRITREIIVNGILHRNVNVDISGLGYHNASAISGVKLFRFKREILMESLLDMEDGEYDIFIPNHDE